MIVLVGESASGKSTVERKLCDLYGYKRVISYTTRPKRDTEKDGVDYHYISKEVFVELINNDYFAEKTVYRDWYYGTSKDDCTVDKVIVANPHGLRQLKNVFGNSVISFYLCLDERERLIRLASRGDDTMECFRRIISDQGVFQNIADDCDYKINCKGLQPKEIALTIHNLINEVNT